MKTKTEEVLCPVCMTFLMSSGPMEAVKMKRCNSCGYAREDVANWDKQCRSHAHSPTTKDEDKHEQK